MFLRFIAALFLSFTIIACQSAPTKVFEKQQVHEKSGEIVEENTIIIDARPAFEYSVAHLPGSFNMRWEDFSQKNKPFTGLLEKDLFFQARRLARYGIQPQSKVLIVGRGDKGRGEEGRLAWTFQLLGIKNVQTKTIDSFSISLTRAESAPQSSVPIWRPQLDESLAVEKTDFVNSVMRPQHQKTNIVVIDVRTVAEYLGKDTTRHDPQFYPDIGAINIPFQNFFKQDGDYNPAIKEKLKELGITENKVIFVIDELGVRSAAVTLALRSLGFQKTSNFAGGYEFLIWDE